MQMSHTFYSIYLNAFAEPDVICGGARAHVIDTARRKVRTICFGICAKLCGWQCGRNGVVGTEIAVSQARFVMKL